MKKDLIVIGGGPAGYEGAIRAAQLGASVALVERDRLGGTCLNRGCIPTKAYYQHARMLHEFARAGDFGIQAGPAAQDPAALAARAADISGRLADGVSRLLDGNGVERIAGNARIPAPGVVEVTGPAGEARVLEATHILLATGSVPALPPIPGLDLPGVLTSDTIWDLREIPGRLLILGGGVIGMEFAGIYRNLGAQVTVLEWLPQILPGMDGELVKRLTLAFKKTGLQIETGFEAKEIRREGESLVLSGEGKSGPAAHEADRILVATGRRPDLPREDLDRLGVDYDAKGIKVDSQYRTNVPGVLAAGDAIGGQMLAHTAAEEAKTAVEYLFGAGEPLDYDAVPACLFAFPEAASCGLTEEEAARRGIGIKTSKFLLGANGKAMTMGEEEGFVKVLADKESGVLLGVHILGPHSSDLIHEGALAIRNRMTAEEILRTVHAHPTLGEAFWEAVAGLSGRAIHQLPPRR